MDIRPVTSGHTLLVPTSHRSGIAELDRATVAALFEAAPSVTRVIYQATGCAGVNWFVVDGEAAGQEVFHFHLHLISRYQGDGYGLRFPPATEGRRHGRCWTKWPAPLATPWKPDTERLRPDWWALQGDSPSRRQRQHRPASESASAGCVLRPGPAPTPLDSGGGRNPGGRLTGARGMPGPGPFRYRWDGAGPTAWRPRRLPTPSRPCFRHHAAPQSEGQRAFPPTKSRRECWLRGFP